MNAQNHEKTRCDILKNKKGDWLVSTLYNVEISKISVIPKKNFNKPLSQKKISILNIWLFLLL